MTDDRNLGKTTFTFCQRRVRVTEVLLYLAKPRRGSQKKSAEGEPFRKKPNAFHYTTHMKAFVWIREVQSRSLMSDQDHVQLRAGQVRQQLNKFQVKETVDHVPFHKFLDLDRHDIRYLSSLTEEKVEEHDKQQEERYKAITEPEHICRLLQNLLRTITLIRSFGALGKTLSLLWCRPDHFHQSARQNRPTSRRYFCRIQRLAQHGRQHRRNCIGWSQELQVQDIAWQNLLQSPTFQPHQWMDRPN